MSIILTQAINTPIQVSSIPLLQKDPRGVGTILSTSLYSASTPSSKTTSDDQAFVGMTQEGYPFLICLDGFYGCQSKNITDFLQKEVLPHVEVYQQQLQQGIDPQKVFYGWQNALFEAKKLYLNQSVDFTLAVVLTFRQHHTFYAAGWSIGDIGMVYKPSQAPFQNLLPMQRVNHFKDAFDDYTCQDPSLIKEVIARSQSFCILIQPGDEIVAYTYVPENLIIADNPILLDSKTSLILARLDLSKLDPSEAPAIDNLWKTLQKAHQKALEILDKKNYRIGDDCTLCQLRFPTVEQRRSRLIQSLELKIPTLKSKYSLINNLLKIPSLYQVAKSWLAHLKSPQNTHSLSPSEQKFLATSSLANLWKEIEECHIEEPSLQTSKPEQNLFLKL